jgi:hypothetical protein
MAIFNSFLYVYQRVAFFANQTWKTHRAFSPCSHGISQPWLFESSRDAWSTGDVSTAPQQNIAEIPSFVEMQYLLYLQLKK